MARPEARLGAAPTSGVAARLVRRIQRVARRSLGRASSSLTRRIVVLNLAGLVALLLGFLTLNQFRQGLIEARVGSLLIQGEIIAGAITASATVDTGAIVMDPDRLLQMQAGEPPSASEETLSPLEFSINPERVAPLLRRLVTPTGTRARIYDHEGTLTLDTRTLYARGDLQRIEPAPLKKSAPSLVERAYSGISGLFRGERTGAEETGPSDARNLVEVQRALVGQAASSVRTNARSETIVSVAVPIQRQRAVRGALLLSTQGGDIDAIIASERFALLQVFLVAALVMIVLSALLAGAIAGPVRRLADAAERVRRGIKSRQEIPDFTARSDEIGHLSGALRDMTQALYNRIDAIESFAADVAHELKNPLTSLRSAVETLPVARTENSRERLMSIIQHDVRRLDRLISDISDASRLEAELARSETEPVDMCRLLETLAAIANERRRPHEPRVVLRIEPAPADAYMVPGHDSRLGQVFTNLLDNARSFSPPDTVVTLGLRLVRDGIEATVEDRGPGIPDHAIERIFERFYTDRPDHGFGQNSGLGLSISRQIVEAHGGAIAASNTEPQAVGETGGALHRDAAAFAQPTVRSGEETLHATCIVLREEGVLIRGPSGAGKSSTARELIARATAAGHFAMLVADDRARVRAHAGRLVARPVPAIAGRLEIRGIGIASYPFEAACVLRWVIDLQDGHPSRMPGPEAFTTDILGIRLRRLMAGPGAAALVYDAIVNGWPAFAPHDCDMDDAHMTVP